MTGEGNLKRPEFLYTSEAETAQTQNKYRLQVRIRRFVNILLAGKAEETRVKGYAFK